MQVKIQQLSLTARVPEYATPGSACFDIRADTAEAVTVMPYGFATVGTGLAMEIPPGYALMVYSRSGHGFKYGVRLANTTGIIDSDYRGEIKLRIKNDSTELFTIQPYERIAQGMIIPAPQVEFILANELGSTERGADGFGSTGR